MASVEQIQQLILITPTGGYTPAGDRIGWSRDLAEAIVKDMEAGVADQLSVRNLLDHVTWAKPSSAHYDWADRVARRFAAEIVTA